MSSASFTSRIRVMATAVFILCVVAHLSSAVARAGENPAPAKEDDVDLQQIETFGGEVYLKTQDVILRPLYFDPSSSRLADFHLSSVLKTLKEDQKSAKKIWHTAHLVITYEHDPKANFSQIDTRKLPRFVLQAATTKTGYKNGFVVRNDVLKLPSKMLPQYFDDLRAYLLSLEERGVNIIKVAASKPWARVPSAKSAYAVIGTFLGYFFQKESDSFFGRKDACAGNGGTCGHDEDFDASMSRLPAGDSKPASSSAR